VSLHLDFMPLLSLAGQVIASAWLLLAAPVGAVIGFALVKRIRWRLAHRAGIERYRAKRF
jgi:hypothetical protein